MKTCCVCGSRPQNLPFSSLDDPRCIALKQRLREEISTAIGRGFLHFVSGMALGVDTFAAQIVLRLGYDNPQLGVTLEAALPCPNQDKFWLPSQQKLYSQLLTYCSQVTLVSKKYTPQCFQLRNQYMVDKSQLIIAATDCRASGTLNTIKYAAHKHKEIVLIDP